MGAEASLSAKPQDAKGAVTLVGFTRRAGLAIAAATLIPPAQAQLVLNRTTLKPRISVAEFGLADGDPARAVQAAIARLPKQGGAILHVPAGIYRFAQHSGPIMRLDGIENLEIDAAGAEFICRGLAQPIVATRCHGLQIRGVTIDWDRLPFSQGDVVAVAHGNLSADIRIDAQFPVDGSETVAAFATYDRTSGLMAIGGLDVYGAVDDVSLVADQTLRLHLKRPVGLRLGDTVVLRHIYGWPHAIDMSACDTIDVTDVTIYAAPGMAVVAGRCKDITVQRLHVMPRPGRSRLMSTCTDAIHFVGSAGRIDIHDCETAGMGDDCINVNAPYLRVVKQIDARRIEVTNRVGTPFRPSDLFPAGDVLTLSRGGTQGKLGDATLASAEAGRNETVHFATDLPFALEPGDLLFDTTDHAELSVSQCRFPGNRARGILAHNDAIIEKCHFGGQTHSAILLSPDATWLEGGPAERVRIRHNEFVAVGRQASQQPTIFVNVVPNPDQSGTSSPGLIVNHDISVQENQFQMCTGPVLACNFVSGVVVEANIILQSGLPTLSFLRSKNIKISKNYCSPAGQVQVDTERFPFSDRSL